MTRVTSARFLSARFDDRGELVEAEVQYTVLARVTDPADLPAELLERVELHERTAEQLDAQVRDKLSEDLGEPAPPREPDSTGDAGGGRVR